MDTKYVTENGIQDKNYISVMALKTNASVEDT